MNKNRIESLSLLALFIAASILLFYVFAPFIQVLALAAVFAVFLHAPFKRLTRSLYGWKTFAASLMVALVLVFFIVPLFFLGIEIFREAQGLYGGLQGDGAQYLARIQSLVENPIRQFLPGFTVDINSYAGSALSFISGNLTSLVYQTLFVVLETVLMLLAFFFFLRDGEAALTSVRRLSPFGESVTSDILANLYFAVQSVTTGTLLIALLRWIFVGAGFFMFGIPDAILWGSIGGVVGAIPGVGTLLVFLPAIAYLFLEGHLVAGIGLTIFTVIALVLLDNTLTPYFFSKGLAAPQVFVLFSILGGILFFGPLGFIFGPLVLSLFLSIFHVYSEMGAVTAARHPKRSPGKSQS